MKTAGTWCRWVGASVAGVVMTIITAPSAVRASEFCTTQPINIPVSECEALNDFYTATQGANWTNDAGWLTNPDISTWWGVTLVASGSTHHVEQISLINNNLVGPLPATLGNLSALRFLYVGSNSIVSLPAEIGLLSQLLVLDATHNDILVLPNTLSGLQNLEQFRLDYNGLSSLPVSLTQLADLSYFSVSHNALTSLPEAIGGLADLQFFDLSYNALTTLPESIGDLDQLVSLSVRNNSLTVLPETIDGWDALVTFDAQSNQLSRLPESFGNLGSTAETGQIIFFQNNQLASVPTSLGSLTQIKELYLNNNQLSSLPESIGDLTNLRVLYLNNNQLTDLPETIGDLASLETLLLHANQLTTLLPQIGNLGVLKWLHAYNNPTLVGRVPATFAQLTALTQLYIHNNALDRTPTHHAVIDAALNSWLAGVNTKHYFGQADIVDPVLSSGSAIPALLVEPLVWEFTVNENSYAVSSTGQGMPIFFTGGQNCTGLSSSDQIMQSSGTLQIVVTMAMTGGYEDCALYTVDHGGNSSEPLLMGSFAYGATPDDWCAHPQVNVPVSECKALFDFYTTLGGTAWTNKTNWLTAFDVDTWHGVRTNLYGGERHVDGLFLQKSSGVDAHGSPQGWGGNNLVGVLPSSINALPYVKDLNLSRNSGLTGTLPDISAWEEIHTVSLEQTSLGGEIPLSWLTRPTLTIFSLANNAFTSLGSGEISLPALQSLNISNNQVSGPLPEGFAMLSALTTLNLSNNEFVGTIPLSWTGMGILSSLSLQENNLHRTVNHTAIIPSALQSRWNTITTKSSVNQGDITPPTVMGTGDIPWLVTGAFTYSLWVEEESYIINPFGEGLLISFTGSQLCESLAASYVEVNGQWSGIQIIPSEPGSYAGCLLSVEDHGENSSEPIMLPSFAYDLSNSSLCYHPELTISQQECIILIDLYNMTVGHEWTVATNWLQTHDVATWYGVQVTSGQVTGIELPNNNLIGTLPVGVTALSALETINLSNNGLTGSIPQQIGVLSGLEVLNLSYNDFAGTLPPSIGILSELRQLDLAANELTGSLPTAWSGLHAIEVIDLSHNTLGGSMSLFSELETLTSLDLAGNRFVGNLPVGLAALDHLETLLVNQNALIRDADHQAVLSGALVSWFGELATGARDHQDDITAPTLQWTGNISPTVVGGISVSVRVQEESYLVSTAGSGLVISATGAGLCEHLFVPEQIMTGSERSLVTVYPLVEGEYSACRLVVTDHGGNVGVAGVLPTFTYAISCGNGEIDEGEYCDEGSYCNDGTPCTDNPGVCPGECAPRLIDDCTPLCQISICGDGFHDPDSDEACDEGKYCNDGTPCTNNPSICLTGPSECTTRLVNGCNQSCAFATCGDGVVDPSMNEECDDGNIFNGDGCSQHCQTEFCGDGVLDTDGADNLSGTADDEECDLGLSNGLLGGTCTATCKLPDQTCDYCYDLCDGGTGNHSIYLLIDVSGSMNRQRLSNAKQGASEFLDLIIEKQAGNTGFNTKVGLISFSSSAKNEISPTTNYAQVKSKINALSAGGGTNFGDALKRARDYYENNDLNRSRQVILLSDGLPTDSSHYSYGAEEWGEYQSELLKDEGVSIYTIAVDQTDEGVEYMNHISSSTYLNWAWRKSANQKSTQSSQGQTTYVASHAVEGDTSGTPYARTASSTSRPWWQVNLGAQYALDELRIWNSTSNASQTAGVWVFVSTTSIPNNNTPTQTLNHPGLVASYYFTGQVPRPWIIPDLDLELVGRYIRVQKNSSSTNSSNRLNLAEVEVMACPLGVEHCSDDYNYEDYQGSAIEDLYKHIFGVIHCGCESQVVCTMCGDGQTHPLLEECDEGSYCADGRECTTNPSICAGECAPRFDAMCTPRCTFTYCGDGQIQTPNAASGQNELCDDGNNVSGDGCSPICMPESCGDGVVDYDGPDNIRGNLDDEKCDDGNTIDDDECRNDCTWTNPVNPIDGACAPYPNGIYNFTGNGTPDAPGMLCLSGMPQQFSYVDNHRVWFCAGELGGNHAQCIVPEYRCGDGITDVGEGEQCDDGNNISGDGCNALCQLEPPLVIPAGQGGSCQSTPPLTIQVDEVLPLYWQAIPVDNIDLDASSCAALDDGKWIPADSVTCTWSIFNSSDGEIHEVRTLQGIDCLRENLASPEISPLINDLVEDQGGSGAQVIGVHLLDDLPSRSAGRQGRYTATMNSISYTFCSRNREHNIQPMPVVYELAGDAPICTIPFTVTDDYILQRGASLASVPNSPLANLWYNELGDSFQDEGFLTSSGSSLPATYQSGVTAQVIHELVAKYQFGAIVPTTVQGTTRSLQKVVNQPIYYFRGTQLSPTITITSQLLADDVPFTLIVENADLIINGSLQGRGMYLVKNGHVRFVNNDCDATDNVQGIFATDLGFETTLIRNNDAEANRRCSGGGLHVEGVLIGQGINQELVDKRRSTIDLWDVSNEVDLFTNYTQLHASGMISDGALIAKKEIKNNRLFDGASLLTTTQPQERQMLPPGARDLLDKLQISVSK